MADCKGRCVLMVVPPARFKDEEYSKPRGMFDRQGITVQVGSIVDKAIFGLNQIRVVPKIQLSAVDVSAYDAIFFVGGMGVRELYENPDALRIAREAVAQDKILASIDMAPTLLARAGVLQGRKATEYFSESKALAAYGVDYTGTTIQQDGNIYTGKGAEAAEKLGFAVVQALQSLEPRS